MGQQPSIQQPSIQQTEPSELDIRARGGCDLDAITEQIRRELGRSRIEEIEKDIYYLHAHGSYEKDTKMIPIPEGITIIQLTAFSSSIWTDTIGNFKQLPTEKQIALFSYHNCRSNIEQDLERISGDEDKKFRRGKRYREDKSWRSDDQLSFLINQHTIPNIYLNFCGEVSTLEEVKSERESLFFKTGLSQRKEPVSFYEMGTNQTINSISTDDKELAAAIIRGQLYESGTTNDDSQEKLIDFFLNRLYSGNYETIEEVMGVWLSELFLNNVLPQGYIFIVACRACEFQPTKVSVGGETGQSVYEKDLEARSMKPLIDAPLDDICSQLSCEQRIHSLDLRADYNFQNAVCKTSGYFCSVCNDYGNCVSCRDSNSVVILPNGKMHDFCSICFTIEEILYIGERFYYSNVKTYDDILGVGNLPTEFVPNPIFPSDCKIDSRIIKFCLALIGNPNQVIFYDRAISTDQQFTQTLYIILCFRYIDFNYIDDFGEYKYLNNFGHEVSKIRFTNVFLQNNTIAVQFVEDINKFLETADITSFLAITEQDYNVMVEKEYEQEQVKINRRSKRDRPY